MDDERQIRWVGFAYDDLLALAGLEATDWKPFDGVSAGTREIRLRDASGIYRMMYVARFEEAIYVLHCFQKKTHVTSKRVQGRCPGQCGSRTRRRHQD